MVAVLTLLIAFVLALTVRHHLRRDAGRSRGWTPHPDDLLIESGWTAGGPGGGHTHAIRVSRDPGVYTRAMSPRK